VIEDAPLQGGDGGFRHEADRELHTWRVWRLIEGSFTSPEGESFSRTYVRSPGASCAVPLLFDAEGNASVVLVRQYRAALGRELLELPAGMRDVDGEPPEETVARELAEEVGLRPGTLEQLAQVEPSAGLTDATTTVYLATGLEPCERELHGPEERHLTVVHLPFTDALDAVERGTITDAKTVIGLLLTARRLDRGDVGPGG
jgi:ADP-ribose pyrophosphatase